MARQKGNTKEVKLTEREKGILSKLCDGLSNGEIAAQLKLSVRTVDAHRARIMLKLGIHHIAGLVKYGIREGLTPA